MGGRRSGGLVGLIVVVLILAFGGVAMASQSTPGGLLVTLDLGSGNVKSLTIPQIIAQSTPSAISGDLAIADTGAPDDAPTSTIAADTIEAPTDVVATDTAEAPTDIVAADTATEAPTDAPTDTDIPDTNTPEPSATPITIQEAAATKLAEASPTPLIIADQPTPNAVTVINTLVPTQPIEQAEAIHTAVPTRTQHRLATPTKVPVQAGVTSAPTGGSSGPTSPVEAASAYTVYIPTASKEHQDYHYTCEFDAAWAIFKTYGIDVTLDQQIAVIGVDTTTEPIYALNPDGSATIHGGDVNNHYSGDYQTNFLARTTGSAMRKVFESFGLTATPVHDKAGIENALKAGHLIWIKTTVDFKTWVPATWIMPDGSSYKTVLGNDHAVVVSGFNDKSVVIRDVLGPTSTNSGRLYEYEVSWPTFLASWGAQSNDGLAITPPAGGAPQILP